MNPIIEKMKADRRSDLSAENEAQKRLMLDQIRKDMGDALMHAKVKCLGLWMAEIVIPGHHRITVRDDGYQNLLYFVELPGVVQPYFKTFIDALIAAEPRDWNHHA